MSQKFSSLHSWLGSEEKLCLGFRKWEWGSHILLCSTGLMSVWGATALHRCHRRFAGPTAWCGAVAWPTEPLDPTKSPGSTSLTPGSNPCFSAGEGTSLSCRPPVSSIGGLDVVELPFQYSEHFKCFFPSNFSLGSPTWTILGWVVEYWEAQVQSWLLGASCCQSFIEAGQFRAPQGPLICPISLPTLQDGLRRGLLRENSNLLG